MTATRALALVCLLVLAGCANPLGGGGETPTETSPAPLAMDDGSTETPTSTPDGEMDNRTTTPDATATPAEGNTSNESNAPPGISQSGLDADALFVAHANALNRTGFVIVGNATGVVSQSGFLVEVETTQRNRMAANGTAYEIRRNAVAGPVERSRHVWSNGSIEYVNRQRDGQSNFSATEARSTELVAGNGLLGPYVRGGDFELRAVRNTSDGRLFVLRATGIGNTTVLERAVTDDAEEITSYDARLAVDEEGRIRAFNGSIEYVLEGQTSTQEFTYGLQHLGDVNVSPPDWLDEARSATGEMGDATATPTATPADD